MQKKQDIIKKILTIVMDLIFSQEKKTIANAVKFRESFILPYNSYQKVLWEKWNMWRTIEKSIVADFNKSL